MTNGPVTPDGSSREGKTFFLIILVIAVALVLAWPATTVECPLWEVQVVNEAGEPLERMAVTLSYQNYSAESEGHSVQKQTDAGGYVVFPQRSLKANRWRRIISTIQ